MRALLGCLLGAVAASLGAQILGEYELRGTLPFVAGPLVGLVVAEVVVAAGGRRGALMASVSASLASLGLLWAGWIDSDEGVEPLPDLVWVAIGLGALTAAWRASEPGRRRS